MDNLTVMVHTLKAETETFIQATFIECRSYARYCTEEVIATLQFVLIDFFIIVSAI